MNPEVDEVVRKIAAAYGLTEKEVTGPYRGAYHMAARRDIIQELP
jgi:hypothetical protein